MSRMSTIIVRTPAKINLCFNIKGLREDAFHEVESIFQSVSLEDQLKIFITETASPSLEISCLNPRMSKLIPLDNTNLIARASAAFFEASGIKNGFSIKVELEKKIPVAAGLAGGSSNAAGMLLALNHYFEAPLNFSSLLELGAAIGSDLPFCLQGGTCLGRGRGEILEEIPCNMNLSYCLLKPRKLSVSTPWAYKSFDEFKNKARPPDLKLAREGLLQGDLEKLISGMSNDFEPVVFEHFPELEKLKQDMLNLGAWHCQMSGSGPTLFALVSGREMGHHLRRQLLHDDEIGYSYGSEEILEETLPAIEFRLAESTTYGARVLTSDSDTEQ